MSSDKSKSISKETDKMLSFAPAPIFTWDHRPTVPSPLSSSPVRASSPISPTHDANSIIQRQTQSSPIQPPKFRFAARQTRPNPLLRRREDRQAEQRKTFLQNVRNKSEEKAWQRRDIEGQSEKVTWLKMQHQVSQGAPDLSEADLQDAITFQQEQPSNLNDMPMEDDYDEQMLAAYEQEYTETVQQPPSPTESDMDYDAIFADFMAQEEMTQGHQPTEQMDMSDEMQI